VLLAYQPVGPKIDRFIKLIQSYPLTSFSCLVDDTIVAELLNSVAHRVNIRLTVYIDLNVGMNRTGILPGKAFALYTKILELSHLQFKGLHAYDGHIHDADFAIRKQQSDAAFALVEQVRKEIMATHSTTPDVVIGGSPTFSIHTKREDVECSPGTFVYWDYSYGTKYEEQPFLPAALVVSRIVSLPEENIICTDLGHKSIAAENPLSNRVYFINAPELVFEGQSEEHLKLRAEKNHSYKIGDVLYGMPIHVCPTCALYEKAITIEDGIADGEWKTIARDRKINV